MQSRTRGSFGDGNERACGRCVSVWSSPASSRGPVKWPSESTRIGGSHGIPRNQSESHRIHGIPRNPMESNGIRWNPIESTESHRIHGIPWNHAESLMIRNLVQKIGPWRTPCSKPIEGVASLPPLTSKCCHCLWYHYMYVWVCMY